MNLDALQQAVNELESLANLPVSREERMERALIRIRAMISDELLDPNPELFLETCKDILQECAFGLK